MQLIIFWIVKNDFLMTILLSATFRVELRFKCYVKNEIILKTNLRKSD